MADLPGIGKKGDKLVNHLSFRWIADRQGIESEAFVGQGTCKAIFFWAPVLKITEYRVSSGGAVARAEYWKKNGQWAFKGVWSLPDGTKLEGEGALVPKDGGNTLVVEGPPGTVSGKKTLPLHDVYKRASK